jgi:hypothetical protein
LVRYFKSRPAIGKEMVNPADKYIEGVSYSPEENKAIKNNLKRYVKPEASLIEYRKWLFKNEEQILKLMKKQSDWL